MATIGIRELRQNASAYLRRVQAGETLRVADRGRPVALLTPLEPASGLRRLESESRLTRSAGNLLALGPPEPARSKAPRPSRVLAKARRNER